MVIHSKKDYFTTKKVTSKSDYAVIPKSVPIHDDES